MNVLEPKTATPHFELEVQTAPPAAIFIWPGPLCFHAVAFDPSNRETNPGSVAWQNCTKSKEHNEARTREQRREFMGEEFMFKDSFVKRERWLQ